MIGTRGRGAGSRGTDQKREPTTVQLVGGAPGGVSPENSDARVIDSGVINVNRPLGTLQAVRRRSSDSAPGVHPGASSAVVRLVISLDAAADVVSAT